MEQATEASSQVSCGRLTRKFVRRSNCFHKAYMYGEKQRMRQLVHRSTRMGTKRQVIAIRFNDLRELPRRGKFLSTG